MGITAIKKMEPVKQINTARTFLKKVTNMKTIPAVATHLIGMVEDANSTFQDFEEVIKIDPTLVLRVLRLVNSSYFSLRTKIKRVSEAIAFIGTDNLRNLIVVDVLKSLFQKDAPGDNFSRKQLWLHCAAVSICCQMIAERIFGIKGEDAFLCGILHDTGLIVENQIAPKKFKEFYHSYIPEKHLITAHENLIMGTNHQIVGYLLTSDWGLSYDIQEAIKGHHETHASVDPASLTGILQMAEYLIFRIERLAYPEVKASLSSSLSGHIKKNIGEYRAIADDLPNEIKRAEEIYFLEKD